jgi:hypothetical protein
MGEFHDVICGTHQSAHKMKWLLQCVGFYWPTLLNDCFRYYKGCESCQKFGNMQLAPAAMLHPIIKLWLFGAWVLDFVGQIHHSSSKGHRFVLVATDYFTKWTKVVPLKNMTHKVVIHFILEHIVHRFRIPQTLTTEQGSSFMSHQVRKFAESIVHRFRIPQTLTTDHGSSFMSHRVRKFAESLKIKLISSSP